MVTNDSQTPDKKEVLLEASEIIKTYGATKAVDKMSVFLNKGEVLGLVGANGAGKSTMMRIISGVTKPDSGTLAFLGNNLNIKEYSTTIARQLGIRVVYQELSLCTNLKVYENFFIEQHQIFAVGNWRRAANEAARKSLDKVFPGNNIDTTEAVSNLSIAQRQMVEIARAACDPDLKLLILDEPTSSLGAEQTEQLIQYVLKTRETGMSFIFISHRLQEVLKICNNVTVMNNGQLKCNNQACSINEAILIQQMGGVSVAEKSLESKTEKRTANYDAANLKLEINKLETDQVHRINAKMYAGEVIGVTGLEGSGQKALLNILYQASRKTAKMNGISIHDTVAYVSGDRAKEGVFPLWSILTNMTITTLTKFKKDILIDKKQEELSGKTWYDRLKIKASDIHVPLTSLSGGNQQKALIARAFLADANIILLDDPSRGVDVETKKQLAQLYREAAAQGKLIIWYSTEEEELTECDRVLVMHDGYLVKELSGSEITKANIIDASFITVEDDKKAKTENGEKKKHTIADFFNKQRTAMPCIALLLIIAVISFVNPHAVSNFGINLLIGSAIPLILASISQMFIIAASDIDLGMGAYLGFANVISATVLIANPALGMLILVLGIVGYGVLGAIIHVRKIPAIVVTLGSSFIWLGIALSVMEKPGGSAPAALVDFFNLDFPLIPMSIILALAIAVISYFIIIRSKYGTVLRGFGNNPKAVARSGWSTLKAKVSLYVLAGFFGVLAGISLTGITTAADANAASSYTLLSIAAVVMGGGELVGGIVEPFGVVFGAVTLSLIGALVGFIHIGSNYQPAVQGCLMFIILAIRIAIRRKNNETCY
ncbi:MAG: inner-rane translocator [Firmicutes bacterium]|nr:inner-rane translocator [Bacillota bacterium]